MSYTYIYNQYTINLIISPSELKVNFFFVIICIHDKKKNLVFTTAFSCSKSNINMLLISFDLLGKTEIFEQNSTCSNVSNLTEDLDNDQLIFTYKTNDENNKQLIHTLHLTNLQI